jgi:tRNA (guanine10-N2)-dimethyltransferase
VRHLIELSGESEDLGRAEAFSVGSLYGSVSSQESDGRALVLESDTPYREMASRLALAWSVSEHLFSCEPDELESLLATHKFIGKTFRVRACRLDEKHTPEEGAALARHVGGLLSPKYRVDLKNPDFELRILMAGKFHLGILAGEIDRTYMEARKPENRPFKHPITLHPKLARTLVNLTRVKQGETLLDPFCGTGGILLEAGLVGCNPIGGDIDLRMIEGTVQNLEHYGIDKPDIRKMDVSDWLSNNRQFDAIATDPPYGRSASTAKEPIESLYKRAFLAFHELLRDGGRLAIALPAEKHTSLAENFILEGMYPIRVHRSLTRYFCVLKKSS